VYTGHRRGVRGVAPFQHGKCVVSGSTDGAIHIWSYDKAQGTTSLVRRLQNDTQLSALCASDDRWVVANCVKRRVIKLWDLHMDAVDAEEGLPPTKVVPDQRLGMCDSLLLGPKGKLLACE
jgi:WD40 repeat protein